MDISGDVHPAFLPGGGLVLLVLTVGLTRLVRQGLLDRDILDRPNERSSHSRPVPRGGGLAVLAILLPAWLLVGAMDDSGAGRHGGALLVPGMAAMLAGLSWLDDRRGGLSRGLRFAAQTLAVLLTLPLLPGPVFQAILPPWLDRVATALVWLWFVNLFNFMDGIDGLASGEAACIGLGLALVAGPGQLAGQAEAVALAATTLGFLWWNWHPARIFLGDVGSVPLGFLLGWLLLNAAAAGAWAVAVILPLYFLADASLTLLRRIVRRENILRPHRQHFYQRAVLAGRSHARVTGAVILVNLGLVGLARLSLSSPGPALGLAAMAVLGLLAWLAGRPDRNPR